MNLPEPSSLTTTTSRSLRRCFAHLCFLKIRIQHKSGLDQTPVGLKDLIRGAAHQATCLHSPDPDLFASIPVLIDRKEFEIGKITVQHKLGQQQVHVAVKQAK